MRRWFGLKYQLSTLYTTSGINYRCHPIWHISIQVVKQLFKQRIPDFRKEFCESGPYSIGTTGDVKNIWVLFVELLLEDCLDMFDGIEVWRVGRVFVDLNVVLLKPFGNQCSMHWRIILLKYSVADSVVNALHDRKDKVLQPLEAHSCIHRFHNKGTESPTIFP